MEQTELILDRSATLFLKDGNLNGQDQAALALLIDGHIRQLAQRSLKRALFLSRTYAKAADKTGGQIVLAAQRTLARVTHQNGLHSEAEAAYKRAWALAKDDAITQARLDRSLIDLYMYLGDFDESRRRAKNALRIFGAKKMVADVAMTNVNYANMMHRQDKHVDAERLYHEAQRYFEGAGDELSAARCYYNRANTLVQLFSFDLAEELYTKADRIYRRHHFYLDATESRYGLAWLKMLRGQFHIALSELQTCENEYRKADHPRGCALCELDRAEVYLGLNLFPDALESARHAGKEFKRLKLHYERAKAELFCAQALLGLKRTSQARIVTERVIAAFAKEQNPGFLGASLLTAAALTTKPDEVLKTLREARKLFTRSQLPLWQAICDVRLIDIPNSATSALNRLENNRAAQSVPHLYSAVQTAIGDQHAKQGKLSIARRHWSRAAQRLETVRAQLPPLEMRDAFSRNRLEPYRRLIDSYLESDPHQAALWIDRYRTAGLWTPISNTLHNDPARISAVAALQSLAEQVSSLSRQISSNKRDYAISLPPSPYSVNKQIASLEKQIRLGMAALEKRTNGNSEETDTLSGYFRLLSYKQPIVQFHLDSANMFAVIHYREGARVHRYEQGKQKIEALMQRWRFLLDQAICSEQENYSSPDEAVLFDRLGKLLWEPLQLPGNADSVLIFPDGVLSNLPWSAVRTKGKPLIDQVAIILAPSVRHFAAAQSRAKQHTGRIFFAAASDDIPQVKKEIQEITANKDRLWITFDPSKRADWLQAERSDAWHFAGHANFRSDNPFYSYLRLADGPLFAADLRLKQTAVNLVTLAACRTGEQTTASGEEPSGFVRSLLEMGARTVVAGHWAVSDTSTALWMKTFYQNYDSNKQISDAARNSSICVRERFPSACHWAAFSVFGPVS